MEVILGLMTALIISGSVIDWILREQSVLDLRDQYNEVIKTMKNSDTNSSIRSLNLLFCNAFDAIYGHKRWSFLRFYRSCFLSLLFVAFSILMIGYENSFLLDPTFRWDSLLSVMFLNIIADFFSLQETRWVLEKSRNSNLIGLILWYFADLLFTTLIYIFGL